MKPTYYIINKSDMSSCESARSALSVAAFLLGRRLDNFILVKDDGTPRVIVPTSPDAHVIEKELLDG